MPFDYTKAIDTNRTALHAIVNEIFILLELILDGTVKQLPRALQQAANRLLVPAESALRRLIVIAARGLKVKLRAPSPSPKASTFASKNIQPPRFQLFDCRKRFFRKRRIKSPIPRIHFFVGPSLTSFSASKAKMPNGSQRLCRRFAAFKSALNNIPKQARRLAHWQAKRAILITPKFRSPIRPGPPPGFRRGLPLKIDIILYECHGLAKDALREAPS